jgi:putative membrane-bound dehydrogenase-like protein
MIALPTPLRPLFAAASAIFSATLLAPLPVASQEGPFNPENVEPTKVPLELFKLPEGLEITLWASSPLFHNPTNIDIDPDGRIWVAEGVRYRGHHGRRPEGDRIVVIEDKDGDGKADHSHTFVQEPGLIAPLGVAVIGKRVIVSQPPDLIVYTDNDGDRIFDASKGDTREVLLTGFSGINHDHSLHSVTAGPDGKWYFNAGNCGGMFTDRSDKTFRIYGPYRPNPIGPFKFPHDAAQYAGQPSDDGHVYVGGFTVRMNPDGTQAEIVGHNYRNSYEQSITSLGDVFQNDNDDPPACRVSWVMDHANFGFASNDGQRSWQADKRPGQTTQIAQWRQEDPGIAPAGDVYGGGSPTGNVFYENGALGDNWVGTFFACEPGRNTIFAYQPRPEGAGFKLERTDFLTTNPEGEFAGSDFIGGSSTAKGETKTLFRPSDIAVGPDGALYVSDWIDPRVGGHQALDPTCSGAIYRIAPKGFKPGVPAFDLSSTEGQVAALKSPAVHTRAAAFEALKAKGRASLEGVAALLGDPNPYLRGRAIFLLYQLGVSGPRYAGYPQQQTDPQLRIAAYRAMRRAGLDITGPAIELAVDSSPAVRREVALSMRDLSIELSQDILVDIAKGYDGEDRTYLEAFGIGATGKEEDLYTLLKDELGGDDSRRWSKAFGDIAWRLHPPKAVEDFAVRASSDVVPMTQREQAMDALAFIDTRAAADAMMTLAQLENPLKAGATWWVLNRASNSWQTHNLMPALKERGIFDPDKVVLQEIIAPDPAATPNNLPPWLRSSNSPAMPSAAKITAQRCQLCHQMGGIGVEVGPGLDGWGRGQTAEVIANSLVNPSTDLAHGYEGTEIKTKDGKTIHGLLIKESDPFIIVSMGGVTQIVPGSQIASRQKMNRSLMLSAAQLGLSAQDVADLVAYLKAN